MQEFPLNKLRKSGVLIEIEVNAVNRARLDVSSCVDKVHVLSLSHSRKMRCEFFRLRLTAGEHVCEAAQFENGRWGDKDDLGQRPPE